MLSARVTVQLLENDIACGQAARVEFELLVSSCYTTWQRKRSSHRVGLELVDLVLVNALVGIEVHVGLLLQDVVEAGSPLAGSEASSARAVVNHEGNTLGVHVGAEGVHSLNHRLVDNLSVRVSSLPEHVNLGHHGGNVHASGGGVEGDLRLNALGTDLLANLRSRLT